MKYLTKLDWMKQLENYDDAKQKILMSLSHDKYRWRTKNGLVNSTGLAPEALESKLAELIDEDLVRPSLSGDKEIIFALKERADL